jgi:hypothetical protein
MVVIIIIVVLIDQIQIFVLVVAPQALIIMLLQILGFGRVELIHVVRMK